MFAHIRQPVREQPDTGYWKSLLAYFPTAPIWVEVRVVGISIHLLLRELWYIFRQALLKKRFENILNLHFAQTFQESKKFQLEIQNLSKSYPQ